MKNLVILSGSGVSAESGIPTFRGMGGIWEKYDVTQLASPDGWMKDQELVLKFYNERRKKLLECHPNGAHKIFADLERDFDVQIITQNVDDLHERAGSTQILHLHGELRKSRSTGPGEEVYDIVGWELKKGDFCPKGYLLRPHIVWFGESVDEMPKAAKIVKSADIFVIVGTSMQVHPAAGLVNYLRGGIPVYVIDPEAVYRKSGVTHIAKGAVEGTIELQNILLNRGS
ncbi:MAG: Sir2 family NAD-dependent protein deacetylase [Verrucomicrobiota bacterium]|nr:Sir2 family NAD-dependent protein deacetylase [Verrucomicrobiota bacterium]